MGASSTANRTRSRSRWATSARSAPAVDEERLRSAIEASQPRFGAAVVADAEITARYRGEHHEFRSRLDAAVQVVRLAWVTEAFFAQVCYRAKVACRARRIPVLPALLHHLSVVTGQVAIGDRAVLDAGIYLPHGQVVIDGLTHLESGVVVRPFVTIGLVDGQPIGPHLGARTKVGTGAKVFGPVVVGADVQIGANAVVNADVAEGATVVGAPARPVR
ncbi:MAG: hypothetical protein R2746_08350 [Acidimicrobiales bacterium]|nr:hypothetical protein [Actinomycetota bacterium]